MRVAGSAKVLSPTGSTLCRQEAQSEWRRGPGQQARQDLLGDHDHGEGFRVDTYVKA